MKTKSIALAARIMLAANMASMMMAFPAKAQRDSCCCPLPLGDTTPGLGRRIPPYANLMPLISPDGKHLSVIDGEYDSAWIIDLTTLERKPIVIYTGLPQVYEGIYDIAWCPYDPDLIAVCVQLKDTFYSGKFWYGHIYTYRLSTGECRRITPEIFGPYGDTLGPFNLLSWRQGSSKSSDTLEITAQVINDDSEEFYIPQTQAIWRTPWAGRLQTIAQTRSESHVVMAQREPGDGNYFLDDSSLLLLDSSIERLGWASFSPNEKLLALSVSPNGQGPPADSIFPQVWVYKMDSLTAPPIVINFQKSFCMYSFWGIDAEFITDSTLAVSMHKDADESSPLWEITLDGRIVRQLTFLPEFPSGVELKSNSSETLRVFPNPATNALQILGGPSGTARLFDLLGRERAEARDDGAGVTMDISHIEAGAYFLRIGNQSAKVEIAR
ncbi:MAG TPA: T9SS type A sorting domain-containing protein [Candidatus Kapabacteria bacterium]|nr:T9SS type A sorting domain-containing protein [Candidatus Kapabacteria bacterium]